MLFSAASNCANIQLKLVSNILNQFTPSSQDDLTAKLHTKRLQRRGKVLQPCHALQGFDLDGQKRKGMLQYPRAQMC